MDFQHSDKVKHYQAELLRFFDEYIYPNEHRFHDEIEANRRAGNVWLATKVVEEPARPPRLPGVRELVSLRIDQDVLEYFQQDGPGWQDRINEALRRAAGK